MAIKKYKPTSNGRRGMTVSTFEEITTSKPEKSLLAPLNKKLDATTKVKSQFVTKPVDTNANIVLLISNVTKTAFQAALLQSSMIQTVHLVSH